MRSTYWQLGILTTISAFAYRHKKNKKNLCRGGRLQDLPSYSTEQKVYTVHRLVQSVHIL